MLTGPSPDELEICLFGPRRAYGESVIVHTGAGNWIVVDSCRESKEQKPAPLAYLESIGVDSGTIGRCVALAWRPHRRLVGAF